MVNKQITLPRESQSKEKCCHYWVLQSPNGPTIKGVCKFCGAEKDFDNVGPDYWPLG